MQHGEELRLRNVQRRPPESPGHLGWAPKGGGEVTAKAPQVSLVRDRGGRQLLVISSQDALLGLQQRDPAAGLQGLSALINDHHVKVALRQQLQRAVRRRACSEGNHASIKVMADSLQLKSHQEIGDKPVLHDWALH
jgi:hypothetical protein